MDLNTKPLAEELDVDEAGFHLCNEAGHRESNNDIGDLRTTADEGPVGENPREGMCFGTLLEARNYYHRYAAKMGFVPKIRNTNYEKHSKDKIPINQSMHCNKDGHRISQKRAPKRAKTITSVGCKARCYVRLDKSTGLWKVSKLELSHTHPLNPKPSAILENRELCQHTKDLIQRNDEVDRQPNKTFQASTSKCVDMDRKISSLNAIHQSLLTSGTTESAGEHGSSSATPSDVIIKDETPFPVNNQTPSDVIIKDKSPIPVNIQNIPEEPSPSPLHSLPEKNRKKGKDTEAGCASEVVSDHDFGFVLKNTFDAGGFIDQYLLDSSTVEVLENIPANENISRMQRMLLKSAILCRDMERSFSDLEKLKEKLAAKEKEIAFLTAQNIELSSKTIELSSQVSRLVEEKKTLSCDLKASEKKASEFKRSLEISRDEMGILKDNYKKLGIVVLEGVTDVEKNIKQQIQLLAPNLDISKVGAYRHIVNGQIVDLLN
ncbi:uncharacterized protein LOC107611085 isoform X4 [Arachis ipaensis]|uniref:uncharacterized protein LOC107611085 isoform X4 n=1 Tax=Arachis ipaensis TaxID=130454 RepID=UPI000A2B3A3D|nr:uncharacterized protein LOC107611085 isoform X4 [Arachis ipaensis]XP_025672938.1 uncharacterized protein LOC112772249 isoform X3 [Arachis hypogaea]